MDTTTTKPWYASTTLWGSIIGGASLVAGFFGAHVDPATQSVVVNQVTAAGAAIGALASTAMTAYGRVKATKAIG